MVRKKKIVVETGDTMISNEELGKFSAPFLRSGSLEFPAEAIIKSPALLLKTRFGVRRIIEIEVNGSRFVLQLNRMSLRNLVQRFGNDSREWVDKKIKLMAVEILGKKAIIAT